MTGFVYLATNDSMPGLVKIGRTDGEVKKRMKALSSATGVVGQFKCQYYCKTNNPAHKEMELHLLFDYCRVEKNREFFRVGWRCVAVALIILTEPNHSERFTKTKDLAAKDQEADDTPVSHSSDLRTNQQIQYMQFVNSRVAKHTTQYLYDNALQYLAEHYLKNESVYDIMRSDKAKKIHQRLLGGGDLYSERIDYASAAMGQYVKFLQQSGR